MNSKIILKIHKRIIQVIEYSKVYKMSPYYHQFILTFGQVKTFGTLQALSVGHTWPHLSFRQALLSSGSVVTEIPCLQVFREARRSVPSVVFMPHISEWWETVSDTVKSTFLTLLHDVPSFCPVLVLATAETHYSQLSDEVGTRHKDALLTHTHLSCKFRFDLEACQVCFMLLCFE